MYKRITVSSDESLYYIFSSVVLDSRVKSNRIILKRKYLFFKANYLSEMDFYPR